MKASGLALLALALSGFAQSRPVVVEESALLPAPSDPSWAYLGRFGVAIDGDYALVSGDRFVPDDGAEGGTRHDGAAFLYHRSGSTWSYAGQLGPTAVITEWVKPGLAMKGGVAMTIIGGARIFELTSGSWTQSVLAPTGSNSVQGPDIEIHNGRILVPQIACTQSAFALTKTAGSWSVEGDLQGQSNDCGDNPPTSFQDLENERAVVFNVEGLNLEPPIARVYARNANGIGWRPYVTLDYALGDSVWGPDVATAQGRWTIITGSREFGTHIIFNTPGGAYGSTIVNSLQPADGYMQPDVRSGTNLERVAGQYFAQRNFSVDRDAYVVNVFRVNADSYYSADHLATLQAARGASLGGPLDSSGNRIIVSGRVNFAGDNRVRIFELPTTFDTPPVQMHDFEAPGAAGAWTAGPGSRFAVVGSGLQHVFRQSSTAGDAGAYLSASAMRDQSIQAEVTARTFNGADRWVGLVTRRADASNYYYVTLRSSGSVQLRRMKSGTFTTLASAPAVVQANRRYRLRLESIGTVHRVFLDEALVLTVDDTSLAQGTAGVAMYRTAADFDNVVVSPGPRTTIYQTDFSGDNPGPANWYLQGDWHNAGVFQQALASGDARAAVGARTADQVVQVRVRATSLPQSSSWVGMLGRWEDAANYLYVSLRRNNSVTLRRLVSGQIRELASAPLTVTPGQWYTVRLEVVAGTTRVFVDDRLTLATTADAGPAGPNLGGGEGKVGLVMYKATAEYDDFLAYQP